MSSKAKSKSKKDAALAFLDDLDSFEVLPASSTLPGNETATEPAAASEVAAPRISHESATAAAGDNEEDPTEALAFLEAQLAQKRTSRVSTPVLHRPASPTSKGPVSAGASVSPVVASAPAGEEPVSQPTSAWGTSFWSTASAALQQAKSVAEQAKSVADEGYNKVKQVDTEGLKKLGLVEGLEGFRQMGAGVVKGVDLEKIRQDILAKGTEAFTELINTVAPPISEHEMLQIYLGHEMKGYNGVTAVVELAISMIMDQTSSSAQTVIFSPSTPPTLPAIPAAASVPTELEPKHSLDATRLLSLATRLVSELGDDNVPLAHQDRSINPVEGWEKGIENGKKGLDGLISRIGKDHNGENSNVPALPLFIYIQPLLVPSPLPTSTTSQLVFIVTLSDPTHTLEFSTVSQYIPGDWMDVEYEASDWVEERLVWVLRGSVEVVVQDYIATRMGLKKVAVKAVEGKVEAVIEKKV